MKQLWRCLDIGRASSARRGTNLIRGMGGKVISLGSFLSTSQPCVAADSLQLQIHPKQKKKKKIHPKPALRNECGPFKYFSFASWHNVKVCQQRAQEERVLLLGSCKVCVSFSSTCSCATHNFPVAGGQQLPQSPHSENLAAECLQ